jgi:hypothetical protein
MDSDGAGKGTFNFKRTEVEVYSISFITVLNECSREPTGKRQAL